MIALIIDTGFSVDGANPAWRTAEGVMGLGILGLWALGPLASLIALIAFGAPSNLPEARVE